MRKPTIAAGALVGLLITVPLVVIFFVGDAIAGLPLATYDVFDWVARVTPGPLITFGIDTMVNTLILLGFDLTETAKTAEQIMAVLGQMATGVALGAAFFAVMGRIHQPGKSSPGLVLGALFGAAVAAISAAVNQTAQTGLAVSTLWILAAHIAWGAVLNYVYDNLAARREDTATAEAEAPATSVEVLSRREFLVRVGTASAAITVVGAGLSAALLPRREGEGAAVASGEGLPPRRASAEELLAEFPNADDPLEPAPGTRPEYTPLEEHYRIDINARPPEVEGADWVLPVTGLVENPLELTLNDLQNNYDPLNQFVTLACISNRIGGELTSTTLWTGASLQEILADAGVMPEATYLNIRAADGFHEAVALDLINEDPRVMLTYHWDGRPLLQKHGFPLRIYIPDRYGMKQPKWITGIEVAAGEESGYWVTRGWDHEAIMKATSVIDTIAVDMMIGDTPLVPIGGIAHAGARGISRVEVRVDSGTWVEAELREPLSGTTWVVWRYDWPFEEGRHTFEVRCVDGNGDTQIEEFTSPRPDGATGIHGQTVML